jgi:hypothetical protein
VVSFASDGGPRDRWTVEDPIAIAVDPYDRAWILADNEIVRLASGGAIAESRRGEFGSFTAIAVDAAGRIALLDRRGSRIALIPPGAAGATDWWSDRDVRLLGLVRDGSSLISVDERTARLIEIKPDRSTRVIANEVVRRPAGITSDPAGQIAVLDSRDDTVVLVAPNGRVRDRVSTASVGVSRPVAIVLGPDGALDVLDAASGRVVRIP